MYCQMERDTTTRMDPAGCRTCDILHRVCRRLLFGDAQGVIVIVLVMEGLDFEGDEYQPGAWMRRWGAAIMLHCLSLVR